MIPAALAPTIGLAGGAAARRPQGRRPPPPADRRGPELLLHGLGQWDKDPRLSLGTVYRFGR